MLTIAGTESSDHIQIQRQQISIISIFFPFFIGSVMGVVLILGSLLVHYVVLHTSVQTNCPS